jgi:multidrug resistance efflux pump
MSVGKQYIRGGLALIIGLAGVLMVLWAWQLPPFKHTVETTDNAYVRGQVRLSVRRSPVMSPRSMSTTIKQ